VLPGLTTLSIVIGLVGLAAYLVPAFLFLDPRGQGEGRRSYGDGHWLAVALVVAGFSHLHYMLFPAVLPSAVSTGDLLRLAFVVVLIVGLAWETRALMLQERGRTEQMSHLSQMKGELHRLLTHDLMHSMGVLRTYAAHLTARWDHMDDGERRFAAERVDRQTARLRDLLDESVAAMDSNGDPPPLVVRPVLATSLLEDGVDSVDNRSGRLRVSVAPGSEDAIVRADRVQMTQVLRNILHNAQSYSPAGTPIDVDLDADAASVRFAVTDRGPGIPPEDLPRLFGRFQRLGHDGGNGNGHANANGHANGDGHDGWGVGLYLSRGIVAAHGGDITVSSEPGAGSTFVVTLPRWAADE
jgi:signal transduction histidine kinase